MSVMDSMKQSVVVPVVVIEDAKDAVPTAKALLAGGIMSWKSRCVQQQRLTASAMWQRNARIW